MPAQSTSDAVARLLSRHQDAEWLSTPRDKRLVIHPDGSQLATLFDNAWCLHAGHAMHYSHAYTQALSPKLEAYQLILLVVAKEQSLNQWILHQLSLQAPSARILIVGEKRGGVTSLVKKLPPAFLKAQKLASGNHCQLFQTRVLTKPLTDSEAPALSGFDVDWRGVSASFSAYPGVFSQGRLDAGTALLLEHLPETIQGKVLDFACGCGVIGALVAQKFAVELTASDVSPMAIASTQMNWEKLGIQGRLILADGLSSLSDGSFNWILSNPPFHTGLRTDYDIGEQFIQQAFKKLAPNGTLVIVANRFLPWPEHMRQVFGHCDELADNGKFKVLLSKRLS